MSDSREARAVIIEKALRAIVEDAGGSELVGDYAGCVAVSDALISQAIDALALADVLRSTVPAGPIIAAIRALPRYGESEVAQRPSMHEWIDAEAVDDLLTAAAEVVSPHDECCELKLGKASCDCGMRLGGSIPQLSEDEHRG